MIAMTTHGRTGLGRWLMGSVTEQVVRESPVPVWITRPPGGDGAGLPGPGTDPLELERILVPLEPEERPEDALSPALEFARIFGARILLLRLVEPWPGAQLRALPGLAASLVGVRRRGLRVETLVEQGDAAEVIATAARHRQAGLVALREPAPRGLSGWLRSGLAERVLRAIRVPLLVVPAF
jgi:nucleotide-binding universal stress UspA family protein